MSEQDLNTLIASLQDKKKSVRTKAVKALKEKSKSAWYYRDFDIAIEPLIAALNDEYWEVRYYAAEALGESKDKRAVEPLVAALQAPINSGNANEKWLVRSYIVQALGKLEDYRAMQPLMVASRDNSGMVRSSATEAIEKLRNNSKVVEQLVGKGTDNTNDAHEISECPKCKTGIVSGALYCPGCGYERITGKEGVGPFSFAFPSVENAYKPSGKGNQRANLIMLLVGSSAGIVGGAVLPFLHRAINHWFAADVPREVSVFDLLVAFLGLWVLNIALAALLGHAIRFAVDKGTIIGKNRDEEMSKRIGLVSGIAGCVVYTLVHFSIYRAEAFDSAIDLVRLALYYLAITIIPARFSGKVIGANPFCEECGKFMRKIKIGKVPIRSESALMGILESGHFESVAGLSDATSKRDRNYSQVSFWHCESCRKNGFINVETTQMRCKYEIKDGKETRSEETQARLIFSLPLGKDAIDTMLTSKPG